jgi:restriction endonuclease Mrr
LKEVKAGKGICVTVGTFTDEAKRFTEARLIDLIEKERLQAMLNTVDAKVAARNTKGKSVSKPSARPQAPRSTPAGSRSAATVKK